MAKMTSMSLPWNGDELAAVVGGTVYRRGNQGFKGVATDTRVDLRGGLFFALKGERFDGTAFASDALAKGASGIVCEPSYDSKALPSFAEPWWGIEVEDALFALGQLAQALRKRYAPPVFGLTGSNGKTTMKELLASIFATRFRTLRTLGNLNNLIGVPLTLLELSRETEVAVIEMGMNAPGEIRRYTEIADPDVGIVLNIGPAHIGKLGSLEAIRDAKAEIFDAMRSEGTCAVINADDPLLVELKPRLRQQVRTFGKTEGAHVQLQSVASEILENGQAVHRISMQVDGQTIDVELFLEGRHNVWNAMAAAAAATTPVARDLGVRIEDIQAGLAAARPPSGRANVRVLGGITLIDDSYNANPASMAAAVEAAAWRAKSSGGRLLMVFGAMAELGSFEREAHERLGKQVVQAGAARVAVLGSGAEPVEEVVKRSNVPCRFEASDADALYAWFRQDLQTGDVVLIKGSRSARTERMCVLLQEDFG
jgi:UDP-N-acetylmuramoyl-tripeptide--D-alanyl-D-alanine ligase